MKHSNIEIQLKHGPKHHCEDCHFSVDCREAPKQGRCERFVYGITTELISHVGDQRWEGKGKNGYHNKTAKRKVQRRVGAHFSGHHYRDSKSKIPKHIKLFCVGVQTDDKGNALGRISHETVEG